MNHRKYLFDNHVQPLQYHEVYVQMQLELEETDEEILEYNLNAMDHNMILNYNELFELYIEFEEHV